MTKMKPLNVDFCLKDIGQKGSYFGFLVNPKMSSVFVDHYLKRNGMEQNETERNGTDWN